MSMDEQIAADLIAEEMRRLGGLSYVELAAMIGICKRTEVSGESGETYALEIEVFWEDSNRYTSRKDLHVTVRTTDGNFLGHFTKLDDD